MLRVAAGRGSEERRRRDRETCGAGEDFRGSLRGRGDAGGESNRGRGRGEVRCGPAPFAPRTLPGGGARPARVRGGRWGSERSPAFVNGQVAGVRGRSSGAAPGCGRRSADSGGTSGDAARLRTWRCLEAGHCGGSARVRSRKAGCGTESVMRGKRPICPPLLLMSLF
jgi:hypothetical protein